MLNHKGKHFSVRGPLNSAPTPQGRPILVQAGAAEQGQDIAGAHADAVYSDGIRSWRGPMVHASLKSRAIRFGRSPDAIKVLPGFTPYVGRTEAEARARYDEMRRLIHPKVGLAVLFNSLGDLSAWPIDGPVPDPSEDVRIRSIGAGLVDMARRDNLSIRDLYEFMAAGNGGRVLVHRNKSPTTCRNGSRKARPMDLTSVRRICPVGYRTSPISSSRSCAAAACFAPNTRGQRWGKTSACRLTSTRIRSIMLTERFRRTRP